jgi:hypothetical protein
MAKAAKVTDLFFGLKETDIIPRAKEIGSQYAGDVGTVISEMLQYVNTGKGIERATLKVFSRIMFDLSNGSVRAIGTGQAMEHRKAFLQIFEGAKDATLRDLRKAQGLPSDSPLAKVDGWNGALQPIFSKVGAILTRKGISEATILAYLGMRIVKAEDGTATLQDIPKGEDGHGGTGTLNGLYLKVAKGRKSTSTEPKVEWKTSPDALAILKWLEWKCGGAWDDELREAIGAAIALEAEEEADKAAA